MPLADVYEHVIVSSFDENTFTAILDDHAREGFRVAGFAAISTDGHRPKLYALIERYRSVGEEKAKR